MSSTVFVQCAGSPQASSKCAGASRDSASTASASVRASIFRSRFLQITRSDYLSDDQYVYLIGVLSQDPELGHAWHLVQLLYGIYQAESEDESAEKVKEFVHDLPRRSLPRFLFSCAVDAIVTPMGGPTRPCMGPGSRP